MSDDNDLLKEMQKLHATFYFAKHNGSPEMQEAATQLEPILSRAVKVIEGSTSVNFTMAKLMDDAAIDRASLKRCREALRRWTAIFASRLAVLEATAGHEVADAVRASRLALGEDPNP